MTDQLKYIYSIDADDIIEFVNDAFEQFARENDAEELTKGTVLGKSVWDFITQNSVQEYYRNLVDNARETGETLTVSFRCDSPSLRRNMKIRIAPESGGRVRFTSWLEKGEIRKPIRALSSKAQTSDSLLAMCSWCKRVNIPHHGWEALESALDIEPDLAHEPYPRFTHGICPDCLAKQRKVLNPLQK